MIFIGDVGQVFGEEGLGSGEAQNSRFRRQTERGGQHHAAWD